MAAERDSRPEVMVVESDAEARRWLQAALGGAGYGVIAAEDCANARTELKGRCCAVVLIDIHLTGSAGVELTRWVKRECPGTEVILITDCATVQSVTEALRLRARDYLSKPLIDSGAVTDSVARALRVGRERLRNQRRLLALEAERKRFLHLFDQLTLGVVLAGADATILLENAAARATLDGGDVLRRDDLGRLTLASAEQTEELLMLVHKCGRDRRARVGGVLKVTRAPGRSPLTVLVAPLDADDATAAVFISDPDRRIVEPEELLRELYGLTRAESLMVAALMQGRSVEQSARDLCISMNTARTHLKHIFAKTGAARQSGLAHLLFSGPALVRPRSIAPCPLDEPS